MKKKVILFVALVVIFCTMTGCGKEKIDVTETVTLNYSGVNGYGVAELENAYEWENKALEKAGIETLDSFSSLGEALLIESAVTYEVYPNENLSNGDKVTVKAVLDNEAVEKYNFVFVASEKEFIVEGLPEIEYIDLFENIDVIYQGIAPSARASISNGNSSLDVQISYSLDKNDNLSNGDIVTVSAEYDKEKLLKSGYMAESDVKEFIVSNVSRYADKLSDITEETDEKLRKQTEDIIKSNIAEVKGYSVDNLTFLGNYFLKSKDNNKWNKLNCIYYVYQVDIVGDEEQTFYYYVGYYDIIVTENGECSYDFSNRVETYETYKWINWTVVYGYENMDLLYNDCVTKNLANYECESTVEDAINSDTLSN